MDQDEVADVEGDAAEIYRAASADPADPPSIASLCRAVTGFSPAVVSMRQDGCCARVGDAWRVFVRKGLAPERARFVVGHELAEWWLRRAGYEREDIEERCDTLGAALVAPREAFRLAVRSLGHSPKATAEVFGVERSLTLLRIGEVTGRPVALVRRNPIVRGEAFAWPEPSQLAEAVRHPPRGVHPVRVGAYWGLMASA